LKKLGTAPEAHTLGTTMINTTGPHPRQPRFRKKLGLSKPLPPLSKLEAKGYGPRNTTRKMGKMGGSEEKVVMGEVL